MKIKFVPINKEVEGTPDKTLLQICTENQIEIKSICKGIPSCAECRIRIVEGEYNVLPPSKAELSLVGTNYFIDQRRLSCQVRCFGNITVDISEQLERAESQTKKVRGFRMPNQKGATVETKAVQGTMVLDEKPPEPQARPQAPRPPQQERQQNNQPRQQKQGQPQRKQGQGGGGQQNQQRNQQNQQNQNQKRDQRPNDKSGKPKESNESKGRDRG